MPTLSSAVRSARYSEQTATFLNLRQLCLRVPGLTAYRAKTLAVAGRIRTQVLPGTAPLYAMEDAAAIFAAEQQAKKGA